MLKVLENRMMLQNWHSILVSFILLFISFPYSQIYAQSYIAYSAPDYEMEYTPEDKIPLNALSLKEIFRGSRQPLSDTYDFTMDEPLEGLTKRSRYYRKYPGKRQNRHYNDLYDCNPNSKETIRLLYAIHQAKLGDIEHIIFCNRVRNPKGIIPNPRYIGKRSEN